VTTPNPQAVIERAIARTKRNAVQQLAIGGAWLVIFPVVWGLTTFVIVMTVINALIAVILTRRLLRLRGAAARALLHEPSQIREIASWPRKLPPNRMPVFIDVTTNAGDTCSLLVDQKNAPEIADLLGALHSRSPDALLSIPKITVTQR
jgi:hypothetical protein